MKILFLGDVMGRAGRRAIVENLPRLREDWRLDFVVVNGENASNGMGLSGEHARLILDAGADCITLGDHAFDQFQHRRPEAEGNQPADQGVCETSKQSRLGSQKEKHHQGTKEDHAGDSDQLVEKGRQGDKEEAKEDKYHHR